MNRSFEKIHNSPINNSTAKQTYVFPKAQRFGDNSYMTYLSHTKRSGSHSPSFAVRRDTSPSPGQYNLPSFAEEAKKKKKGPSICHTERYRTHSSHLFEPGPGSYSPKPIEKAPSISFGSGKARNFLKTSHDWASPASYCAQKYNTIDANKAFKSSSFKNQGRCVFPKAPRFDKKQSQKKVEPGPGHQSFSEFSQRRYTLADKLNRLTALIKR